MRRCGGNAVITFDCINSYFSRYMELPHRNVFSPAGFTALAEWSERQSWWGTFAKRHDLEGNWRSTIMGDSNLFAINLYAFLNPARHCQDGSQRTRASAT
jgi:hypothetical protein